MTFYDEAELAGIQMVRLALDEGDPRSMEMAAVVDSIGERFGQAGVYALSIALARHLSAAMFVDSQRKGRSMDEHIDAYEIHVLDTHRFDADEME